MVLQAGVEICRDSLSVICMMCGIVIYSVYANNFMRKGNFMH